MPIGSQDPHLKEERRNRLNGGLDSRSSPLTIDPSASTQIQDLVFDTEGSLSVRKVESLQVSLVWPSANDDLPAPTLAAVAAGGTFAAGTYDVRYELLNFISATPNFVSTSAQIVLALNDALRVDVPPSNLGEARGQGADGADDPFSANVSAGVASLVPAIWIKKTTDATWLRVAGLSVTWSWVGASRVQRATVTSYSLGVSSLPASGATGFPLRKLVWHPGIQYLIGVSVDRAGFFAANLSTFTYAALAKDKSGVNHVFSRIQTPMRDAYVDQVMMLSDGLAKPKKLNWTGALATSSWRVCGATAPTSGQKPGINSIQPGPGITGTFSYKLTYIYSTTRADGTVLTVESNASAASTSTGAISDKVVRVTIPGNNDEAGITTRQLYRTKSGGSIFYKVPTGNIAAGTGSTTFDDSTADAALDTTTTPPDEGDKVGNDTPPTILDHLTEHQSRAWGVESNYILDNSTDLRIIDSLPTHYVRCTKAPSLGTSEAVDAWPTEFRYPAGDSTPITATLSYNGDLVIFRSNRIGKIVGNSEDDYTYIDTLNNVGAMRHSVVQVGGLVMFWEDARGPIAFDGYRDQPLGHKIDPTWKVDRAAGFRPVLAWYDPEVELVLWQMTTVTKVPPGNWTGVASAWKQFAFHLPSRAWTILQGSGGTVAARPYTSFARCVLSSNLASQIGTSVVSSYDGRLSIDFFQNDQTTIGSFTTAIFLGESWEMIKLSRYLQVYYSTANSVWSIQIQMGCVGNPTLKTVTTLTSSDGYHQAGRAQDGYSKGSLLTTHIRCLKISSDLIINLRLDDTIEAGAPTREMDWGYFFKFIITGGGVTIHGISWQHKDVSDTESVEWPGT